MLLFAEENQLSNHEFPSSVRTTTYQSSIRKSVQVQSTDAESPPTLSVHTKRCYVPFSLQCKSQSTIKLLMSQPSRSRNEIRFPKLYQSARGRIRRILHSFWTTVINSYMTNSVKECVGSQNKVFLSSMQNEFYDVPDYWIQLLKYLFNYRLQQDERRLSFYRSISDQIEILLGVFMGCFEAIADALRTFLQFSTTDIFNDLNDACIDQISEYALDTQSANDPFRNRFQENNLASFLYVMPFSDNIMQLRNVLTMQSIDKSSKEQILSHRMKDPLETRQVEGNRIGLLLPDLKSSPGLIDTQIDRKHNLLDIVKSVKSCIELLQCWGLTESQNIRLSYKEKNPESNVDTKPLCIDQNRLKISKEFYDEVSD